MHAPEPDRPVRFATLQAEFEALHPFLDGNGRLGRIPVPLFPWEAGMVVPRCLTLAPISKLDTTSTATPLWPCPATTTGRAGAGGVQAAGRRRSGRGAGNHRPVWCQRARVIERPRPLYAILALDRAFEWPVFRGTDFVARAGIPLSAERRILGVLREAGVVRVLRPARAPVGGPDVPGIALHCPVSERSLP